MRRRWHKPGALAALLALVLALSCDRGPQPDNSPLAPQTSGDLLNLGGLLGRRVQQPQGVTLITETSQSGQTFTSSIISLLGGTLSLAGHSVLVPQGAVLEPTLFTMFVPTTPVIDVDLYAFSGNLITGTLGLLDSFERPVTLELSYARATNVTNAERLVIIRLLDDGRYEVMPSTVDPLRQVVRAQLDHFSKYAMASN